MLRTDDETLRRRTNDDDQLPDAFGSCRMENIDPARG